MSLDELPSTFAKARHSDRQPLPWHLRKRFVLPVMAVLLVGAVSSTLLLASAIYTYVRVQLALEELRSDLSGLGLLGTPASSVELPADTAAAIDATSGVGEVGESGTVTYDLSGDLKDVTVTWVYMSNGATMTREGEAMDFPLSFVVDGNWEKIGFEAHRGGRGTGQLSCSVTGESSFVAAQDSASGKDASVSCYL